MKKPFTYLLVMAAILSATSCREDKKASAEKLVMEWIGKEIVFPPEPGCSYMGTDTLCPDPGNAPYKVLVYTDSVGCTSCRLNLHLWKIYMEEVDKDLPGQVDFLFYFQPKNRKELGHILRREGLKRTVFIDEKGELNRINSFPEGMVYQCFLLDRDNKVLSIGSPALNPTIWELYKQVITNANE